MKTKTKTIMISTLCSTFLLLLMTPMAYAGSCEDNPNPPNSILVHSREKIHQDKFIPYANNLEFRAHIYEPKEWGYHVLGYRVTIDCFPTVNCWRTEKPSPLLEGGMSEGIDVRAEDALIENCSYCTIDIKFWLNKKNNIRKQDITWTFEIEAVKALPDHGWRVDDEIITIYNEDPTASFTIAGFVYRVDPNLYANLETVVFDRSIPGNFTVPPGGNKPFSISLDHVGVGYVYFHYQMLDAPGGNVLSEEWAAHEMPSLVGGIWVAVDKLALLAPYIALASTILLATAATAIYVKHVKHRKKKQ